MTTTVSIAAEDLLTELVAEGCDPTLVSSLIDSMMYAGLNLDQNDDGPALLDGGEAELIREHAEAARDARWVVCEARQANERTGQLRGITDDEDVFDLVNAAANATWAAVERPVLDQLV